MARTNASADLHAEVAALREELDGLPRLLYRVGVIGAHQEQAIAAERAKLAAERASPSRE
jgi:hypothetical protein